MHPTGASRSEASQSLQPNMCFCFFIYKMGMITIVSTSDCCEVKGDKIERTLSAMPVPQGSVNVNACT